MFFLIFVILITILIFGVVLYLIYSPVMISGDSMHPTLKDGEIYFTHRVFNKSNLKVGKIYVYKSPVENKYVIKRLTEISSQGLFFVGDNKKHSYDSRSYGYVPFENVRYYVYTRKEG